MLCVLAAPSSSTTRLKAVHLLSPLPQGHPVAGFRWQVASKRVCPSGRGLGEDAGWKGRLSSPSWLRTKAGSAPVSPCEELNHRPASSASSFCPFISLFYPQVNSLPAERIQEIQKAIELFSVGQGPAKTMEEASKRSYQFWDTQPVPKLGTCNPSPCCTPWSCLVVPRLSKEALVGAVRVYGQRVSPWMAPHCCIWALVSTDPPPADPAAGGLHAWLGGLGRTRSHLRRLLWCLLYLGSLSLIL